jgi:hypothetical protein
MTRRFRFPYSGKRYLANTNKNQVHDLDNEQTSENECQIDEIKTEHIKMYDYLSQAHQDKYQDCDYCLKPVKHS